MNVKAVEVKSNCGYFRLLPKQLKEKSLFPYVMKRSEVARIFRNPNETIGVTFHHASIMYSGRNCNARYSSVMGNLRIGCQRFRPEATKLIRKWALCRR